MSKRKHACAIPLGFNAALNRPSMMGFQQAKAASGAGGDFVEYAGDGHLVTIAPTGAGKGVSCIIPALLTYPGSTLTIDLKGENLAVTARRRREMGHAVVVLDPFQITNGPRDKLNPFDLLKLPGSGGDADLEMLSELMSGGHVLLGNDRFWDQVGRGMNTGILGMAVESPEPGDRHIGTFLDTLYADDVDYTIAVYLDKHPTMKHRLARQELTAYLGHESDKCRPSVRSTAQALVKCLGSDSVREMLSATTFDLHGWMTGMPLDLFLVFPPDKLESHRGLLRLILGTLAQVLMRRQTMPEHRTLLLLDECAQLGTLPMLRVAMTLLRGYGVQTWSFWQDLSQLKQNYPTDWETILNNAAVLQTFGANNGMTAKTVADVLDVNPAAVLGLPRADQFVMRPGETASQMRRCDYRKDRRFSGLYDRNPRYPMGR
jgi:type IV secretion system protein VirD4